MNLLLEAEGIPCITSMWYKHTQHHGETVSKRKIEKVPKELLGLAEDIYRQTIESTNCFCFVFLFLAACEEVHEELIRKKKASIWFSRRI